MVATPEDRFSHVHLYLYNSYQSWNMKINVLYFVSDFTCICDVSDDLYIVGTYCERWLISTKFIYC